MTLNSACWSGLLMVGIAASGMALAADPSSTTLLLWDGAPPGLVANAGEERTFPQWPDTVANVSVPTMSVYLPPAGKSSGVALVYCSGGSYNKVSRVADETVNVDYFVQRGAAVFVVKYRTTPPAARDYSDALADGKRAVRVVRHRAKEWRIDPQKIGMLGGSAGGHLILSVATHWDRGRTDVAEPIEKESCRPDFIVLLCPWPNNQPVSDFHITKETPPAFLCSARDDTIAPTAFAEGIVAACAKAGVPAKLRLIDTGGHAAWGKGGAGADWVEELIPWLKSIGIWQE